jgi:hypothetical protein
LFFLDVSIYFPKNVESNNSQGMAEMPGNPWIQRDTSLWTWEGTPIVCCTHGCTTQHITKHFWICKLSSLKMRKIVSPPYKAICFLFLGRISHQTIVSNNFRTIQGYFYGMPNSVFTLPDQRRCDILIFWYRIVQIYSTEMYPYCSDCRSHFNRFKRLKKSVQCWIKTIMQKKRDNHWLHWYELSTVYL